jgi:winged helix DNA-binding protein
MLRSDPVLSPRTLNRALLARQLLLARQRRPVLDAIAHLVGMQAQVPLDPYSGLWSRLEGFRTHELGDAILERRLVRIALQRSTIHLVAAEDCLALQPLLQVVQDRELMGHFGRALDGVDVVAVADAGRAIVERRPIAFRELGGQLAERWPGRDPLALAIAVRTQVPLVQPPPRGVWGRRGQALHTSVEKWLGRAPGPAIERSELVLRYLGAFGPASVMDAQLWCGLKRLRDVFEGLRPQLVTFRDEGGVELFDLPEAPRPDPEVPAPPRFLPQFDNVLLSHAERSRIAPPGIGKRIHRQHGHWSPLLVDGFLRGTWKLRRERRAARLAIELDPALESPDQAAIGEEAVRLLEFLAEDAESRDVDFL